MAQLTIRLVDAELRMRLEAQARQRGLSLNRTVLALLREAIGLRHHQSGPPIEFNDLDHLAGTWSEEEAAQFDNELRKQRRIDEELWD